MSEVPRKRNWYRGRGGRYQYRRGGQNNSRTTSTNDSSNGQQRLLTVDVTKYVGPYKGWPLYHPEEEFKESSETHRKVIAAEEYLTKNRSTFNVALEKQSFLEIDLLHLQSDEEFKSSWTSFEEELVNNPLYTLGCLGLAAHQIFNVEDKLSVRPMNLLPVTSLANLKVNYFGKLVTIRGTVIRVSSPGLVCKSMAFECTSCHATQSLVQNQGIYAPPSVCMSCKSGAKFEPIRSSPFTITQDSQTARIQETQVQGVSGSIPKSIEVELNSDLVGITSPGDLVSVTGIVRVRGETRSGGEAHLMQLYIEAVAVHNQRTLNHPTLTFTLKDYYAIQEIHSTDNVFRLLVQSLCPSIFGQEIVKAGLILGLLGGTEVEGGSRANPHLLMVGDPGLGKSQLLQAATLVAPRGVYVCGNACTASGLTVSLSRSEGSGFTLEAGALVLSDRGICCVDELDKLNATGHGALLEAMEQGSVSVARGGVVCRLAASPTVLAAANPFHGHYDRSKTVCENLHMSAALLSRFDLVFILLDRPDEKIDALLSDHVLAMHSGAEPKNKTFSSFISDSSQTDQTSLLERLRMQLDEIFDPLPVVLLRKYIAYSRKYVHPKLSKEASTVLQDFYLKIRSNNKSKVGNAAVTTRQLEACIRLTQARARVCLREEATVEDARDVVEIMKHSLIHTLCDEFGVIEMTRSVHGSGMSSKSNVKKFIAVITQQASKLKKDVFHRKELMQIHSTFNLSGDPSSLIESLHVHGYLLLKGPSVYKLLTL